MSEASNTHMNGLAVHFNGEAKKTCPRKCIRKE
jgi:hypothetical protein